MQDGISTPRDAFDAHFSGGGTEQGQQFGGPFTAVFVVVTRRLPFRIPGRSGIGNRLIRPGFVLTPEGEAQRVGQRIGVLD